MSLSIFACIAHIFLLLTVPLYVMLLSVLLKYRKHEILRQPFFKLLFSVSVADMCQALTLIVLFIFTDAGLFPQVFIRLGAISARITNICIYGFSSAQSFGAFLIAANRFTAYVAPLKHQRIWNGKVVGVSILVQWIVALLTAAPLFHSYFEFRIAIVDGKERIQWEDANVLALYTLVVTGVYCGTLSLITLLLYVVLFSKAIAKKCTSKQPFSKIEQNVLKMAVVGFVSSCGMFIMILDVATLLLAWHIFQIDFPPVDTFWAVHDFGNYAFTAVNPYALLIFSAAIREHFRQLFCWYLPRKAKVQHTSTNVGRKSIVARQAFR